MKCIKTGCDVFLMSHGEFVHGDAHLTESGDLVIRTSCSERQPIGSRRHFTIMEAEHWFDEDRPKGQYGTMIVTKGMFTNHGYDGVEEPALAAN